MDTGNTECCFFYLNPEWVYNFIKFPKEKDSLDSLAKNIHPLHVTLPMAKSLPQFSILCAGDDAHSKFITTIPAAVDTKCALISNHQRDYQINADDLDSQERETLPFSDHTVQKVGKYACMMDSNPELNRKQQTDTASKKKINLNSHITGKFKDLQKIYEMVCFFKSRTYVAKMSFF